VLNNRRSARSRSQRGSILSALLIIVAFLSILGGALISQISGQFLLTRTLADRLASQATINSSVENAIGQLQTRNVPWRCSTDSGAAWSVNLNGLWSNAASNCQAIVPDQVARLTGGSFQVDGTHVNSSGRNTYLVGSSAGRVYNYNFGDSAPLWSVAVGAAVSGPPAESMDPSEPGQFMAVVPVGNDVALVDDFGSGASRRCLMDATGTVTSRPGFENPPAGRAPYFPTDVFFGDSSGRLYVYDASTDGGCNPIASTSGLGGAVVAGPLVLSGQQLRGLSSCPVGDPERSQVTTTADVFAVVNSASGGRLVHYRFCQVTDAGQVVGDALTLADSKSLGISTPVGASFSGTTPAGGSTIRLAVTGATGQVALGSITATDLFPGLGYSIAGGPAVTLGGSFSHAPYWCHCPGGDQIGAGDGNGTFFILGPALQQLLQYGGAAAINTTPTADSNGDWYFGANDGYVYDVEPPAAGMVMIKAARFGPGVQVSSSPVEGGSADGCPDRICMYFGVPSGAYLAQIGIGRVLDVKACLTSSSASTQCTGSLRLWTRLEVGDPQYLGARGVNVIGWSYYGGA
jgi:hypothetical protein